MVRVRKVGVKQADVLCRRAAFLAAAVAALAAAAVVDALPVDPALAAFLVVLEGMMEAGVRRGVTQ